MICVQQLQTSVRPSVQGGGAALATNSVAQALPAMAALAQMEAGTPTPPTAGLATELTGRKEPSLKAKMDTAGRQISPGAQVPVGDMAPPRREERDGQGAFS